jgi:hypothetical protein
MPASAPNRLRHKRSLMTTTRERCVTSSAVKVRPAIGLMPRTSKNAAGDCLPGNPFRRATQSGQCPAAAGNCRNGGKCLLLFRPVEKIERSYPVVYETRRPFPQHDE